MGKRRKENFSIDLQQEGIFYQLCFPLFFFLFFFSIIIQSILISSFSFKSIRFSPTENWLGRSRNSLGHPCCLVGRRVSLFFSFLFLFSLLFFLFLSFLEREKTTTRNDQKKKKKKEQTSVSSGSCPQKPGKSLSNVKMVEFLLFPLVKFPRVYFFPVESHRALNKREVSEIIIFKKNKVESKSMVTFSMAWVLEFLCVLEIQRRQFLLLF